MRATFIATILIVGVLYGMYYLNNVDLNKESPIVGTSYAIKDVRYDSMQPSTTLVTTARGERPIANINLKVFMDKALKESRFVESKDRTQHALVLTEADYNNYNLNYKDVHKSELPYIKYKSTKGVW